MTREFKVGDKVVGIDVKGENPYVLTNTNMTLGEVIDVESSTVIRVKILEGVKGTRTADDIGSSHRVRSAYFKLAKTKLETKVYKGEDLLKVIENVAVRYLEIENPATGIDRIIHNEDAVIVILDNGKKSVAKVREGDTFDLEKGIAVALLKYQKRLIEKLLKKF